MAMAQAANNKDNLRDELSLTERIAAWYSRYFPDATIFALILSLVALMATIFFTPTTPADALTYFFDGFPSLFNFAFQLMFMNAAALAIVDMPHISGYIRSAARLVKTPMAAYVTTVVIGSITSWLGWWIGPVVTATMARTFGKEIKGIDYRLLSAMAYASFTVWVSGLSGTIPLFVASKNPFDNLTGGTLSIQQTVFSPMNLYATLALIVGLAITAWWMARSKKTITTFYDLVTDPKAVDEQQASGTNSEELESTTFADKVSQLRFWTLSLGLIGVGFCVYYFYTKGYSGLNLNSLAFLVFFLGFVLHKNAVTYGKAFMKNVGAGASIALQFPIYGGIALLLNKSGLAAMMAGGLVSLSTAETFPLIGFLSNGIVNFFVPSAGSQYTAVAGIILPAAQELGVEVNRAVMVINYGQAWTDLIQPFWTLLYLPILGAGTRLQPRDIMGYCLPVVFLYGIIWALALTFLPI